MYFGSKRKSAARRLKLRDRIISMLLAVSLLCGNPIVLPTGAAELVAYCGIEEHSHSEECYTTDSVLTCGVTQENHVHSEACKQTEKTLTCTIVEQVHEHTDACYTTTTNLTCTEHVHTADCAQLTCTDTTEGHEHTDACYAYICESPNATHQHTDSCYTTESVLNCDYHQHTDACYTATAVNTCGVTQENHKHSEACYGEQKTLFCTQEEHTHTLACYSNPEADLQTADDWEGTLPEEDEFTGTWAKDLLAVAESQVGYTESVKNYQVAEDGETLMGYNRYGAWYASVSGIDSYAYAPWNVTFLFFDLYHCGISFMDFPYEEDCAEWVRRLDEDNYKLYRAAGEYTPIPGDMIFLDTDGDGEADRAGIVSEVTEDELIAIEGDVDGAVAEVTYDLSDTKAAVAAEADEDPQPQILGYADMAQAQADAQPENSIVSDLATLTWSHSSYLYLDLGGIAWTRDGAHIVLAYYDGDIDWSFAEMEYDSNTSLYRIELPDDMVLTDSKFEFVRMNSSGTFSWSNKWNRTGAEDEYHILQDNTNVFRLSGWNTGSWQSYVQSPTNSDSGSGDDESVPYDTLPELAQGYRRVFYDATLSKLSYTGDSGSKGDFGIPKSGKNLIYCWADKLYTMNHLTSYTEDGHTWTDVYFVDIPSSCTKVTFASFALENATNYGGHGESTTQLTIPSGYTKPCFYADTSDKTIYDGGQRGGYWAEVFTIRNAETGKNMDVVDISSAAMTTSSSKMYMNATFYDYYTDYELNGYNRDNYDQNATKTTDRIYQPFRQFNQALSDYYSGVSASNPIYWGNFQNFEGDHFREIADTLNLFGYSGSTNKFFAENNSMWGYNGGELTNDGRDGAQATMGLVNSSLTNGNLMVKTSSGTVAAPFFSKSFLQGNNSKNTVLGEVYENVSFPFSKESLGSSSLNDETGSSHGTVDYWVFDSRDTTLQMKYDSTSGYWLDDSTSDVYGSTPDKDSTTDRNFFPFNSSTQSAKSQQLNYGFATKLEFTFRLTEDGTVVSTTGEEIPIEFNFSGDDDVWVFIDGQLALDVGGGHGRVSGYLNFRDKEYYVSRIKDSSSGVTYDKKDSFQIEGNNTDEHTLTMFYMERGLWESNMMITFNFPDENLLEVEKVVDKTAVNQDLFGGLFDNKSMFTFNIKNLATHYGTVAVSTDTVDPVTLDTTDTSGKVSLTAYGSNIFDRYKLTAFGSDDSVVHWYAHETDSTSDYREKRYGNLWLNTGTGSPNIVDLSKMAYMEFEVYFQDATPSLSKMYIQLKDTKDNILTKSDSQKQYLSSCVYGTVTPVANNWFKIRLSLSSMLASSLTEETILQYIRFGYNEPVNIYLRGFKFLPAISASESNVGFVKQQYTIPDYGSATTGVLQPAAGAVYTSNITSLARATANAVDADGNFVLSAGETASFYNQFRRGSYISLTENVSGDLFDTRWTIYEGGKAVTQMGTGTTVTNGTSIVNNVSGTAVDDGRTENYLTGTPDGYKIENAYNGTKPQANTFVFRSFSNPDNAVSATKLKVVFTNKVKTGSLTINKKQAGSEALDGEFTFYVVFTNVGGMSLESSPITVDPFELSVNGSMTITGIPLNTEYAIYEIKPENEEITLDHVKVGGAEVTYTVTTYGDSSAYMTTGTVTANDSDNSHTVEYYNINKPVVSLTLTKTWVGEENDENLPRSIRVQLQYSTDDGKTWTPIEGYYKDTTIGPGYAPWSTYTYTFADLDKNKYNEDGDIEAEYMYRVVELDSKGKVIDADGTVTIGGDEFTVSYGTSGKAELVSGTTNKYSQTITNTVIPTVKLEITKLDATDQTKLAGVEFKLEKDGSTIGTQTTGTDGIATFEELKAGTYTLTETKTAEGYSLLKSAITVVIANDGSSATVDGKDATITTGTDGVKTIELTIYNKKNLSMPSTGGVYGFEYWILGGLCITAVPLLLYTLFGFKKGGKYRRR